jgi:hypothetical protein
MMRFIADRFWAEMGGNPALIRTGYKGIGGGAGGWGAPNSWMIGNAAVAAMVDEEYRPMLDNMARALADYDPDTGKRPELYRIGKAYYLMHLVGLMDFRIEGAAKIDRVDAIEQGNGLESSAVNPAPPSYAAVLSLPLPQRWQPHHPEN